MKNAVKWSVRVIGFSLIVYGVSLIHLASSLIVAGVLLFIMYAGIMKKPTTVYWVFDDPENPELLKIVRTKPESPQPNPHWKKVTYHKEW